MADDLAEQALATWRTNNEIDLFLLRNLRPGGLDAVTLLKDGQPSKGRTVARVFAHLHNVRLSWVGRAAKTAKKAKSEVAEFPSAKEESAPPDLAALEKALTASGKLIEEVLREALAAGTMKSFDGPPLLWLGYLLAHEAHHRGQIVLALKQSGLRVSDEVAYGLWTYWQGYIYRKDNRVPKTPGT